MLKDNSAAKSGHWYDKLGDVYDELHFKKRKGARHGCGVDVEGVVPSEGEVRLLGNRHKQCAYYRIGKHSFFLQLHFDDVNVLDS